MDIADNKLNDDYDVQAVDALETGDNKNNYNFKNDDEIIPVAVSEGTNSCTFGGKGETCQSKYSTDGWHSENGWCGFYNYKAHQCINGFFSMYSVNGLFALFVVNALYSIFSCNSIMSLMSVNSAFSILSSNSAFAIGCSNGFMEICFGK